MQVITNSSISKNGTCVVPEGVKYISGQVFMEQSGLKKLLLPNSLLAIGARAISRTIIEELIIPDSVIILKENALTNNPNYLKSAV